MSIREVLQELSGLPEPLIKEDLNKMPDIVKKIREINGETKNPEKYLSINSAKIAAEQGVEESIVKKAQFISYLIENRWSSTDILRRARIKYDDLANITIVLKGTNKVKINKNTADAADLETQISDKRISNPDTYVKSEHKTYFITESRYKLAYTILKVGLTAGLCLLTTAVVTSNITSQNESKKYSTIIPALEAKVDSLTTQLKGNEQQEKTEKQEYKKQEKAADTINTDRIVEEYKKTGNIRLITENRDGLDSIKIKECYTQLFREGSFDKTAKLEQAYGQIMLEDKDLKYTIKKYWENINLYQALAGQDCSKKRLAKTGLNSDYIDYVNQELEKAKSKN